MSKRGRRGWRQAWLENISRGYLQEDGRPELLRSWLLRSVLVGLFGGVVVGLLVYLVSDPSGWSMGPAVAVVVLVWVPIFLAGEFVWRQVGRLAVRSLRRSDVPVSDSTLEP